MNKTMKLLISVILFSFFATGALCTGWSEIIPTERAITLSGGYLYNVSDGDWKAHPFAPVELFGSGHGFRIDGAVAADWLRFGGVFSAYFAENSEWENYASTPVVASSRFYNLGWFFAVNPLYSKRISPLIGLEIGYFIPSTEEYVNDYSNQHRTEYDFLARNGYSNFVAPFIAGVFRLNNNYDIIPIVGLHSAAKSQKLSGGNSRINWYFFGVSIAARIPLSLF